MAESIQAAFLAFDYLTHGIEAAGPIVLASSSRLAGRQKVVKYRSCPSGKAMPSPAGIKTFPMRRSSKS